MEERRLLKLLEPPDDPGFGIYMSIIGGILTTILILIFSLVIRQISDNNWIDNSIILECDIINYSITGAINSKKKYVLSVILNCYNFTDYTDVSFSDYYDNLVESEKNYPLNSNITVNYNKNGSPTIRINPKKSSIIGYIIAYVIIITLLISCCLSIYICDVKTKVNMKK